MKLGAALRRLLPITLQSHYMGVANRLRMGIKTSAGRCRLFGWALFYVLIFTATFLATVHILRKPAVGAMLALVGPGPVGRSLVAMLFQGYVLISFFRGLSRLFRAFDIDWHLLSPRSPIYFWAGQICDCCYVVGSSILIVVGPIVVGCGYVYHAPLIFYPMALLAVSGLLISGTAIGTAACTLFVAFFSSRTAQRLVSITFTLGVLAIILTIINDQQTTEGAVSSPLIFTHIVTATDNTILRFLPSGWASAILGHTIYWGAVDFPLPQLSIFLFSVVLCLGFGALCHLLLYERALGASREQSGAPLAERQNAPQRAVIARPAWSENLTVTLMTNGFRMYCRDISLLGRLFCWIVCLIGLLRAMPSKPTMSAKIEGYGAIFDAEYASMALVVSLFLIVLFGGMFSYPSVSMEGGAWWILRGSPRRVADFLARKHILNFLVALLFCLPFVATSGFIADAPFGLIIIETLVVCFMCYGVTGLGVGFGAWGARFDWVDPSSPLLSTTNLFFVVGAFLSGGVGLLPLWLLKTLSAQPLSGFPKLSPDRWYVALLATLVLVGLFNRAIAAWALAKGSQALEARDI